MNDIVRDQQGVERCHKIVDTVIPNDPKNHALGFKPVQAYCNKPMTMSVAEGRKVCPEHDKQPPVGWVNPKITNAAGVTLTAKEMSECGLNPDGTRIDGKEIPVRKNVETVKASNAVEAPMIAQKRDNEVVLHIPLQDLESNADVAAYLIQQVLASFGSLPVSNYAESKRLMKLEEKLTSLLEA